VLDVVQPEQLMAAALDLAHRIAGGCRCLQLSQAKSLPRLVSRHSLQPVDTLCLGNNLQGACSVTETYTRPFWHRAREWYVP
jgi:hypothetical protein